MGASSRRRRAQSALGLSVERFARLGLTVVLVVLLVTAGAMALEGAVSRGGDGAAGADEPWWARLTSPFRSTPDRVVVAWTSGGLPEGLAGRVEALDEVLATSVVRGDLGELAASWDEDGGVVDQPSEELSIPLDILAVDPSAHAKGFADDAPEALVNLQPGEALLSESSATLRGLGPGSTVELAGGQTYAVRGVVDDVFAGSAELVLHAADAEAQGISTERFVLVRHSGEREGLAAAIEEAAGHHPLEVAAPEEVEAFRHGGTLLPQVAVKQRFGEFAYRPGAGRAIVQNDAWVDEHITTAGVPILGRVTCHRELIPRLRGALEAVEEANLGHTIDRAGYAGCYEPRLINEGGALSRHAWGLAIDLNARQNPYGAEPRQDPRLVKIFDQWGFTWGGRWLVPDGMHFEHDGQAR